MKAGWDIKDLGAVSAINYGYTESASSEPIGPRFLRIIDIQKDHVDWDSVPYCKIESAEVAKYRLASGDIVFARTGATTGKSFLVKEPPKAVFASYLIRLRLLDKKLLPEFVSLFFQTDGYWKSIKDGSAGSAQGGFNASKLAALTIPIPPRLEQQRIVGILDEAFDGIASAKAKAGKNLQNARALFESHLQSVFTQRGEGWTEKRLGELYSFKNGINFDKTQKIDRGILTIDVLNMYGDDLQVGLDNIYRVNKEVTGEYILKNGDILVVRSSVKREGVGWAKVFRVVKEPITFCGFIIRGRPIGAVLSEYVVYFLRSQQTRDEMIKRATQSTITNINQFNLGELVVPLPSLPEQKLIVNKLDTLREKTQHLEAIYRQKLAALDALKKSLLDQAFTGQL